MKVKLIAHTPDPELLVAMAAKLCYSSCGIDELVEAQTDESVRQFIARLVKLGHYSPFEHATFTFAIEGISRTTLAQLTRHRIASCSVQSQRYVDMSDAINIVPPAIAANEKLCKLFEGVTKVSTLAYEELTHGLAEQYVADGMATSVAKKKAQEDARYVLQNSCGVNLIVTMNARSLLNFFELRCCKRAQWEIRALANAMLILVKQVAPNLFAAAGPSCVRGECSEGPMSCGNPVRDEFADEKAEEDQTCM